MRIRTADLYERWTWDGRFAGNLLIKLHRTRCRSYYEKLTEYFFERRLSSSSPPQGPLLPGIDLNLRFRGIS